MNNKVPPTSGVYAFREIGSELVYVGSSRNIRRRLKEHKSCLNKGTHKNRKVTEVFLRAGWDGMEFSVIREAKDSLPALEECWIKMLDSVNNGLNIWPGYTGAGVPCSEETKRKLSAHNTGKKLSPETKKKLSDKGRSGGLASWVTRRARGNIHRSPEASAKAAASNRGKKRTEEVKLKLSQGVSKVTPDTVHKIAALLWEGVSAKEIGRIVGVTGTTIGNIRNKKLKFMNGNWPDFPPSPVQVRRNKGGNE